MSIEFRSDVINYLINKRNYKSYLEIGLDHPDSNYNLINCEHKVSVDPYLDPESWLKESMVDDRLPDFITNVLTHRLKSDDYFNNYSDTFDLIFIDGLHKESQVGRDIINAAAHLNRGGVILVHDCLPKYEINNVYPRVWDWFNGDGWKAVLQISYELNISFRVLDINEGIGIFEYQPQLENIFIPYPKECKLTYSEVFSHRTLRDYIMHVITVDEFLRLY